MESVFALVSQLQVFAFVMVIVISNIYYLLTFYFGLWCNGSTIDFGSISLGSSPNGPTVFWFFHLFSRLTPFFVMFSQTAFTLFLICIKYSFTPSFVKIMGLKASWWNR